MPTVPSTPVADQQARADLTRLLVHLYNLPTSDRPRCWACQALDLTELGRTTCDQLQCEARPEVTAA